MVKRINILVFTVLATVCFSTNAKNTPDASFLLLDQLLTTEHSPTSSSEVTNFKNKLSFYIEDFKKKKIKWQDNKRTLAYIFHKIHRKFLKKYIPYQSFSDLIDDGTYGCLTGTALYAMVLDQLDYKHDIVETNYHIYILVHASGQRYILETTDPIDGFLGTESEVLTRLDEIKQKSSIPVSSSGHKFTFTINRTVTFDELIGLQYYNMAINAYNNQQYLEAIAQLDKAYTHYQSERVDEFLRLIIKYIAEKHSLLIQLNITKHRYPILATL